jgi:hypothetical protein
MLPRIAPINPLQQPDSTNQQRGRKIPALIFDDRMPGHER